MQSSFSNLSISIDRQPSQTFNESFFKWIEGAQTPKAAIQALDQYKGTPYESSYATAAVYASYLKRAPSSHFSRKDASVYLAECNNDDILDKYFKPHYFVNMSLEESLRFVFTDLKLKILNDTIKLNILLERLAKSYLIANSNKIKKINMEHIAEYVETYNIMIMLENSIHSKTKQTIMTEEQFMDFLMDTILDEDEMEEIYHNICKLSLYEKNDHKQA